MEVQDNKIFIYVRLRDDKEVLYKSRIREFAAIGKILADFMKEVLARFGMQSLKSAHLEYVDANTDMVLISFRRDVIRQQYIVSGLIPTEYRSRMLSEEETKLKMPATEFVDKIATDLDPLQKPLLYEKLQHSVDILKLIRQNIHANGEFYLILNQFASNNSSDDI